MLSVWVFFTNNIDNRIGMNKIISKILYLFFGEWNGIQNFIAPSVLIFTFNQYSFIHWITGVLTYQRFYLPLLVYLVMLYSVIFLCLKAYFQWNNLPNSPRKNTDVHAFKDFILPFILKLHLWLFIFLTLILAVYIFKNGYTFIYRQSFPIFIVYYWLLRIGAIAMTLYIFALLEIAIPLIKKGKSFNWAQRYFHKFLMKHWRTAIPILAVQLLWIYVSVLLFSLLIGQLQNLIGLDLLLSHGKPLEIIFQEVHSVGQFMSNLLWLLFAFMFSNLLYSPIMLLTNKGLNRFHLSFKVIWDATTKKVLSRTQ